MYPFLAMIIATFLFIIFTWLKKAPLTSHYLFRNPLPYLFLFLIFTSPYSDIWNKTYKPTNWDKEFYAISNYLKTAVKGNADIDNYFLAFDGYNAHIKFYLHILDEKGVVIDFKNWTELSPGDKINLGQNHVKEYIDNNYHVELLNVQWPLVFYQIIDKKIQQ